MSYKGNLSPNFHIFDFGRFKPGVGNLPAEISFGSTPSSPVFRYNGKDATLVNWIPWGYGKELTYSGSGDNVTLNNGSPFFTDSDNSVLCVNSKRYWTLKNDYKYAEIPINYDFVIEAVIQTNPNNNYHIAFGCVDGGYNPWEVGIADDNTVYIYTGATSPRSVYTVKTNNIYHILYISSYYDRVNSKPSNLFINGVNARSIITPAGALAGGADFYVGGGGPTTNEGNLFNGGISFFSFYKAPIGWINSSSVSSSAVQRFAEICGTYPRHARGTKTYSTSSHPSENTSSKLELNGSYTNHIVGPNWPRVCSTASVDGSIFIGYLAGANDILRYQGNDGNLPGGGNYGAGTICFEFIGSGSAATNKDLFSINKSGSAADNIKCYIGTDSYLHVDIKATGGTAGHVNTSTSVLDGKIHEVTIPYKNNDLRLIMNDVEVSTDSSVTIPVGLDRIEIGASESGSNQPETVLLSNWRIYSNFDRE